MHISIHSGFDMPFFSDKEPVSETLFNDKSLSDLIEMQNGRAENIVAECGSDVLLATPTEDIVELAYEVCHLEVPVLLEDKAYQAEPREIIREVQDYGRAVRVPGFEYRITILSRVILVCLGIHHRSALVTRRGPKRMRTASPSPPRVTISPAKTLRRISKRRSTRSNLD